MSSTFWGSPNQAQLSQTDLHSEELEKVLREFGQMKYDEILDQLAGTGIVIGLNIKILFVPKFARVV